jgi:hypothetical protein
MATDQKANYAGSNTIPSIPPYTTWKGFMVVPPDSPYAARLLNKCNGEVMTESVERNLYNSVGDVQRGVDGKPMRHRVGGKNWIAGNWIAPDNWVEWVAGREN